MPQKKLSAENSIKHIAKRISIQEGEKDEMINEYLEDVKRNLLQNLSEFDKSNTSMKSGTNNDIADAQSDDQEIRLTENELDKVHEFLQSIKDQEDQIRMKAKGKIVKQ